MALDLLATTLGQMRVKQHLLAVAPSDLAAMVKAGNGYLQLQPSYSKRSRSHAVQTEEDDSKEMESEQQVSPVSIQAADMQSTLVEMVKVLQLIVGQLENPKATPN